MAIFEAEAYEPAYRDVTQGQAGLVSLVGAGPGEADLITVKGLRRLQAADVVITDRLIAHSLLDEAPAHALIIDAGKAAGKHTLTQDAINHLLVHHARLGRRVVRLKGGDPFVFGRGGEEALSLVAAGIPFEIVPGVSSAFAVPAYAGIPVTHRSLTTSFTVVTGHDPAGVRWEALASLGGTLVILMSMATLPAITDRLIAAGMDAATPAAIIEDGATPRQRVILGTVENIGVRGHDAAVGSPALTVIGAVVSLHDALHWWDTVGSGLLSQTD